MTDELALEIGADHREAAQLAADRIAAAAREAVAERGRFTMAASGGDTPWLMLAMLAASDMPWELTELYQVDERIAAPGSADRNLTHLVLTLPIEKQASIRPMPVTRRDLEQAAAEYEEGLPDPLDLVHLGLGADGHTASLMPGDPILGVNDRRVALTGSPYRGHRRMSLTYPAINGARLRVWLVTGDDRQDALEGLREGDASSPANGVRRDATIVVADASAAAGEHPVAPLDGNPAA